MRFSLFRWYKNPRPGQDLLRAGNLNELGDFLAGVFTPLAFGWLVYGYLLQSKELRLQREELALTRKQLGKQTELLQEQVITDYQDSIPRLALRIASPEDWWGWIVENKGGPAKGIELLKLDENRRVAEKNSLVRGEFFQFQVSTPSSRIGSSLSLIRAIWGHLTKRKNRTLRKLGGAGRCRVGVCLNWTRMGAMGVYSSAGGGRKPGSAIRWTGCSTHTSR